MKQSTKMAARRAAREIALHLVYEKSFMTKPAVELVANRLEEGSFGSLGGEADAYASALPESEKSYVTRLVEGVEQAEPELREAISKYSVGWRIERISRVSAAILKIAIYEIRFFDDIDISVSINEAIELAKKYDTAEAAAFINGLLGAFVRGEKAE